MLIDLLQSLIHPQANIAPQAPMPPPAQASVDPVSVTARPQPTQPAPIVRQAPMTQQLMPPPNIPQPTPPPGPPGQDGSPPPFDYNNSQSNDAVNQAVAGEHTRGGSANQGVYGLLPQNLQHGTLRNVLGALGDAFLVGSNRPAQYRPRMEQQEIGAAMAGMDINDPASVAAAVQRVAATGAPGSVEMADKLQQQAEQAALRRQYMEYNQDYRNQMVQTRHDSALARMTPYIGGMVAGAHDPASYASAYQRAESIAQRIGPDYHASDFGLVDPQDWTPGATATTGMTANNVQSSADRAASRQTSERNTDVRAGATIGAANIGAGSRERAAGISAGRPSDAQQRQALIDKQDRGEALTPAEQAAWAHLTQTGGRGRRGLPGTGGGTSADPGAAAGDILGRSLGGGGNSRFQNGQVYQDAHGNKARYQNGQWVIIH